MTFLANLARRGRDHPALVRPRVQALFEPPAEAPRETFAEREQRSVARPSSAPAGTAGATSAEREEHGVASPPDAPASTGPASPVVTPPAVRRPAAEPARARTSGGDSARPDPAPKRTASRGVAAPRPEQPEPLERSNLAAPTTMGVDEPSPRSGAPGAGRDGPARAVPSPETMPVPANATTPAPAPAPADLRMDADGPPAQTLEAARTSTPAGPPAAAEPRHGTVDPAPAPGGPPSTLVVQAAAVAPRTDDADGAVQRTLVAGQPLVVRALPARRAAAPPASPRERAPGTSRVRAQALEIDDAASAPTEVHVTIGRLEVRATAAAAPPAARQPAPAPMSLEEHLRQRAGGRR